MYFKGGFTNMAHVTDAPRIRVSENHDVFSSRITRKRKSDGERQRKSEEMRARGGRTCVLQVLPRYKVWHIKVRLTGCLSSNYAPLQLVPACCRRHPRRGQIVYVINGSGLCNCVIYYINEKYTNFNRIIKLK